MRSVSIQELVSLIFALRRRIWQRAGGEKNMDPISMLRLHTLRYVAERGKPSMREIADHLHVAPPSATSLINTLVKNGMLARVIDPEDRRRVRMAVTAKGKGSIEAGFKFMATQMAHTLSRLDQGERAIFACILRKLSS